MGIKTYWSTLNKIVNKKKTTNIDPILEKGLFVTNFQTKADMFNEFFVQQCSLNINDSTFPNPISRCSVYLKDTEINPEKLLKIIRALDCNKTHRWDNLSVSMIKICNAELVKPLCLIFNQCLETGIFPETWKRGNVVPTHKKESRQLKKSYRPISLLPVFWKDFREDYL